ncbi:hypothetical protein DFJ74DRAFT_746509 [Hyaloraphidium curvatum]|nr:hypothetical protein DFJ74DRAFT_746509 [Hyaloraphidium curvatum]
MRPVSSRSPAANTTYAIDDDSLATTTCDPAGLIAARPATPADPPPQLYAEPPKGSLLALPPEVLERVAGLLPPADASRLSRACRAFAAELRTLAVETALDAELTRLEVQRDRLNRMPIRTPPVARDRRGRRMNARPSTVRAGISGEALRVLQSANNLQMDILELAWEVAFDASGANAARTMRELGRSWKAGSRNQSAWPEREELSRIRDDWERHRERATRPGRPLRHGMSPAQLMHLFWVAARGDNSHPEP